MIISKASASRIKTYKDCAFKYFIEYHLKFPPSRADTIYTTKGNAVHEALEYLVNHHLGKEEKAELDYEKKLIDYYRKTKLWTLDIRKPHKGFPHPVIKTCESCPWASKDSICSIADKPTGNVDGCPRPNFEDDLNLTKQTLSSSRCEALVLEDGEFKEKILGAEVSFDEKLGCAPVRGYIDLVYEVNQDTIEIIDYKTGNNALSYKKAYKDPQVRIYSAVARQLWPDYKYIMTTLYYLRKKPVTVTLSQEDDMETIEALEFRFKEIQQNVNPCRKKNWLCNFCVGWENCGIIHNNFMVDGKFKFPIIECAHAEVPNKCWGGLYPENADDITVNNIHQATYACGGHRKLHEGGEYVEDTRDS